MKEGLFNSIDLIIVPGVLIILTLFCFLYIRKQPPEIKKYFFPAFFLRVLGTVLLAIIYNFFYGYGDTFFYYINTQTLSTYLYSDPARWFRIIISNPASGGEDVTAILEKIESFSHYCYLVFKQSENANVSKIAAVFNIVCFDSYIGMALFFGMLSFLGCWYIFKTFVHIYPGYEKQFAWLCLYLPSLWFWGCGILKDPICIFGLGLLFYNFFVKRKNLLKRSLLIALGIFLLLSVKSYIFYSFAAGAIGSVIINGYRRFNFFAKIGVIAFFAILLVALYPVIYGAVMQSMEDLIKQSEAFIQAYSSTGSEGDATFIPDFDPTPLGLATLGLEGLVNVYLKPFPWEAKKILYIFLILENLLLYYIMVKKIKSGPTDFKKNHRMLLYFCFVFVLVLGFVIGVTTFNLGTIARYRVPALPFLFSGIFLWKLSRRKKRIDRSAVSEITISNDTIIPPVYIYKE